MYRLTSCMLIGFFSRSSASVFSSSLQKLSLAISQIDLSRVVTYSQHLCKRSSLKLPVSTMRLKQSLNCSLANRQLVNLALIRGRQFIPQVSLETYSFLRVTLAVVRPATIYLQMSIEVWSMKSWMMRLRRCYLARTMRVGLCLSLILLLRSCWISRKAHLQTQLSVAQGFSEYCRSEGSLSPQQRWHMSAKVTVLSDSSLITYDLGIQPFQSFLIACFLSILQSVLKSQGGCMQWMLSEEGMTFQQTCWSGLSS